jgi:hypothetical protein
MQRLTLEVLPQVGNTGKYFVGNVLFEEQKFLSIQKVFVPISPEVGLQIRETLGTGAEVLLTKDQVENPGDLTYDDFEVISHSDFEVEKRKAIFEIRNKISYSTATISALDLYGFHSLYSSLLSRGYNISDENREEKYLEIINTGDEELLKLLEDYIEVKDGIDATAKMYQLLKQYLLELEETTTQDELDQVKANIPFS